MDNKYLPYGELETGFLTRRITYILGELINSLAPVDLLVIACNTASTQTLDALREKFDFPIVGVVPAIKPAAELTQTKTIGLLATPATISNDYTASLINRYASNSHVLLYGSSELVRLAEQSFWADHYDQNELGTELGKLNINQNIDYLVLGCTHFPLLSAGLKKSLGEKIKLLDSGLAIANRVVNLLGISEKDLQNKKQPVTYYATAAFEQTKLAINNIDY
jgi:glutamate racemase